MGQLERANKSALDKVIQKNIKTVEQIEEATKKSRSSSEVVADKVANFCGSIVFVWVHIVWFGSWILWNSLPFVPKGAKFDPPPFGNLTLIVSLEAIFLSTFILISQNRQQELADQRNELDLQINLLAEQESSYTIKMLTALLKHHEIEIPDKELDKALEATTDTSRIAEAVKHIVKEQKD
jgi:uncharacterized membrane protein